jgi:hypothetical protein
MQKDGNSLTKCFPTVKSNKRHERYCRMKGKVPSRTKSCLPCIKAKARCELEGQTCARCAKKCIICHFESAVRRDVAVEAKDMAIDYGGILIDSESSFLAPPDDMDGGSRNEASSSLQLPIVNGIYEFDFIVPQFEFPIDGSAFTSIEDVLSFGAGADITPPFQQHISGTSKPTKLFDPIPPKKRESSAASVVATRILRSYPDMMVQRTTFPPFIHPRFSEMGAERRLPRALANITSIAQMFQQRSTENRIFIWQSIQTEQQRIMSQVSQ